MNFNIEGEDSSDESEYALPDRTIEFEMSVYESDFHK